MEVMDKNQRDKFDRAKKRVEDVKGFYYHLASYLGVNIFITTMKIIRDLDNGASFGEALFDFGTFAVWFFWGIGLLFHGAKVFSLNPIFGKDWEERQIQKYIERDKRESEKYK